MSITSTLDEQESPEAEWDTATSFSFWICSLAATLIYAAVALSPVLHMHRSLQHEFDQYQQKLVQLQQKHRELNKLTRTLEEEPQLRRELSQLDFQAGVAGYKQVPMSRRLNTPKSRVAKPIRLIPSDWERFIARLATNSQLRGLLLFLAAGLTVFAFTFLQPAATEGEEENIGLGQ